MWLAGRPGITIVCLLGALSGTAWAAEVADPFAAVLAREERGEFAASLRQLRSSEELLKAHREHEAALVALLHAFDSVQTSLASGQHDQARSVLEALLPRLDPVRDTYLMHAAHARLVQLRDLGRRMAEADVARADQLAKDGKDAEAIAIYSDVAQSEASEIPAALKRRARQAMARAEAAKAEAEAVGFWGKTWKSASEGIFTLAGWSVFLLIGTLLVWAAQARRRKRKPREETLIVLEDLTAQAPERETMSQGLIRELLLRFGSLGKGEDLAADIDTLADIDGSSQANLRMEAEPVADVPSVIQDGAAVQIGPFSLTPRQLVALVRAYFRRPWKTRLSGSLVRQGEQVLLLIERSTEDQGATLVDRWEARADGDDARAVVVQRMATRLAFELAKIRLTSDWRSFEAYRDAMAHLARAEGEETREPLLEAACRDLQRSLRHDPANWIARFQLGVTQRKLGQNESAAKHFQFLEWMASDGAQGAGPLAAYLEKKPEFLFTLRYNKAVALSKVPNWEAHKKAVQLLNELVDGAATPDNESGIRLEMLARSARAAALTFELEDPPAGDGSAKGQERMRRFQGQVFDRIDQERAWIKALPVATARLDWKAYSLSFAVTHNAYGRACYLLGRKGGEEALREALTMSPDFAESYITLAELSMRRRKPQDWSKQVEDLLKRALEINPSNQRAHYLLGKLYADPAVADYPKAKEHLVKAELVPWSYAILARILDEEGDVAEAVRKMRRSIALSPKPDHRFELFVRYALRVLADQKPPNRDLLQEAKDVASKLTEAGKEMGDKLLQNIRDFEQRSAARDRSRPKALAAPVSVPDAARETEMAQETELPCAPTPERAAEGSPPPAEAARP
jgi:tetratricopeptide (TPR) repeat protein